MRIKYILLLFFGFLISFQRAVSQRIPVVNKEQLQNLAEENGNEEITDDSYLQDLHHFMSIPINLNTATAEQLIRLRTLNQIQIENFISFRKLLGKLIDLHELQSIPGWDIHTIQQILPYVSIGDVDLKLPSLKQRFLKGSSTMLVRYGQVMQQARGYEIDTSIAKNYYLGSRPQFFVRYKYSFKNIFQYGLTGSKDAGEEFFKGSQKSGFDFYSFHLFARDLGKLKSIALGDFTVNMGQGLIQWQSLGVRKSSDVINIERQSELLRPYNSSGQVNFHRGVGLSFEQHHFQTMAFLSYRKLDATFKTDSLGDDFVSALQSSGYHRTPSELNHKNKLTQLSVGGAISYNKDQFHIGLNTIAYFFGTPIKKSTKLYNKYVFSGSRLWDNSLDYSFTWKSIHSFGEIAMDNDFHKAFISGMIMALDKKIDVSLLYRSISKSFHSLYSNSFTENSTPINENGFYAGLKLNLTDKMILSGYTDVFSFPWIKYRVDMPSSGSDYLVLIHYLPNKKYKFSSSYRLHKKPANYNPDKLPISPVLAIPTQTLRISFDMISQDFPIELGCKAAYIGYNSNGKTAEKGIMGSFEFGYYPKTLPYFINAGYTYFKTDGNNSKIYSFESNVLYSVSIPGVSNKGNRAYINLNYDWNKCLSAYFKYSRTFYPDKTTIGSGLDRIYGDHKSDVKFELLLKF